MKRNNYDDKINKINSERIEMLKNIREGLTNKYNNLDNSIKDLQLVLLYDQTNLKEYNSVIKCKKIIYTLVEEISNANSVEDIIKIRRKINYYINKIKKIINDRDISDDILDSIKKDTSYLRKDISKYIRFLKRESKLEEINNLNNIFSELSNDDKNKLKRYLSNELKYNRVNLKKHDNKTTKDNSESLSVINQDRKIDNSILDNLSYYMGLYSFKELEMNDNKKIISLLKNIPNYYWNKKVIKKMILDNKYIFNNEDLSAYINYSKKRNSISLVLDSIFKRSNLSAREKECLYNHNKCREWINEFYYNNIDNQYKLIQ